MSRIANDPVALPSGVEVKISGQNVDVKGGKGSMAMRVNDLVEVRQEDGVLTFRARDNSKSAVALAGTMRSLVGNMVTGVSTGFEKKLELQGVGYRAQAKGNSLSLQLGFLIRSSTRCRKASRCKRPVRRKLSSRAWTSSWSGRCLQRFDRFAHRSRIKARACGTRTNA